MEAAVQRALRDAIAQGLVSSAHDCAEGGLFVALAECAMLGSLGATLDTPLDYFVESPSRIVVSTDHPEALMSLDIPATKLGMTGGGRLAISGVCDLALSELRQAYDSGLERGLA
jgi:phosphoribosylformylglycinamidine synthase